MARKTIGARIKESLSDYLRYHVADMSGVKPSYRYSAKNNTFYLDSCAGMIRFKPRGQLELETFRSNWINKFDRLCSSDAKKSEFLKFYRELLSQVKRATYKANMRTKLRLNSGV